MTKKKEKYVDCQGAYYPDNPHLFDGKKSYTEANQCNTDANCPGYACVRSQDPKGKCVTQEGSKQKSSQACQDCGTCPSSTPNEVSCGGKTFCCKSTVCKTDNSDCCDQSKVYDTNKCCDHDLCGTSCCDLTSTKCVNGSCCPNKNVYNVSGQDMCCPKETCEGNCCSSDQTCISNIGCCDNNNVCGANCCEKGSMCNTIKNVCEYRYAKVQKDAPNNKGSYWSCERSDSGTMTYDDCKLSSLTYYCDSSE